MEYLLAWAVLTYGVTLVITQSKLTRRLRRLLKPLEDNSRPQSASNKALPRGWLQTFFGTLLECPMCMGAWVGGALSLLGASPAAKIFGRLRIAGRLPFEEIYLFAVLDGFSSALVCWFFYVLLHSLGSDDL